MLKLVYFSSSIPGNFCGPVFNSLHSGNAASTNIRFKRFPNPPLEATKRPNIGLFGSHISTAAHGSPILPDGTNKPASIHPANTDEALDGIFEALPDGAIIPEYIYDQYPAQAIAEALIQRLNRRSQTSPEIKRLFDLSRMELYFPSSRITDILENGFLNQHQSGRSTYTYNPILRSRLETALFGLKFEPVYVPGLNIVNAIRPKHAILEFENAENVFSSRGADMAERYGDVVAVLKDELKKRATWTPGDSLNLRHEIENAAVAANTFTSPLGDKTATRAPYYEAQILGPITVSDVDYFMIPTSLEASRLDELKRAGVPIYTYVERKDRATWSFSRTRDRAVFAPVETRHHHPPRYHRAVVKEIYRELHRLTQGSPTASELLEAWLRYAKQDDTDEILLEIWKIIRRQAQQSSFKQKMISLTAKASPYENPGHYLLHELLRLDTPLAVLKRYKRAQSERDREAVLIILAHEFSCFAGDPRYQKDLEQALLTRTAPIRKYMLEEDADLFSIPGLNALPTWSSVMNSFLHTTDRSSGIRIHSRVLLRPHLLADPRWQGWFRELRLIKGSELAQLEILSSRRIHQHPEYSRQWVPWFDAMVIAGNDDNLLERRLMEFISLREHPRSPIWRKALTLPKNQRGNALQEEPKSIL